MIRVFNKSKLNDKLNPDYIYPTTHDAVLSIIKSRNVVERRQKRESFLAEQEPHQVNQDLNIQLGISLISNVVDVSSTSDAQIGSSSLSIDIEKDKYEKLEGEDNLTSKVYVKKTDDYDIINEIVSSI